MPPALLTVRSLSDKDKVWYRSADGDWEHGERQDEKRSFCRREKGAPTEVKRLAGTGGSSTTPAVAQVALFVGLGLFC
jgi:hypothetical protein